MLRTTQRGVLCHPDGLLRRLLVPALILLLASARGHSTATTYYVAPSPTGSDARSCATAQVITTPKATVSSGATCLSPDDTLLVRAGTYDDWLNNTDIAGTSWSHKIRIAAYPGDTVTMRPSLGQTASYVVYLAHSQAYIEFDGIIFDGQYTWAGALKVEENSCCAGMANHIRFQNGETLSNPLATADDRMQGVILDAGTVEGSVGGNEVINMTIHRIRSDDFSHGIYIKSSGNLIQGNTIYDFPGAGIHVFNDHHMVYGNIIRNNVVRDGLTTPPVPLPQRHWGIILANGSNTAQVYNNVVYGMPTQDASSSAFLLLFAGSGNLLYNNTAYGNAGYGINIGNGDPSPLSTQVTNNISYNNAGGNYFNSGTSTVASSNLFGVDPHFVNASGGDFHLTTSSTAAIDQAVAISAVTTDKDGNARPQGVKPDIGAYEYVVLGPVPAAPTGLRVVPH